MSQYVAYYRVSTQKQGVSGLGLEAQRASVEGFVRGDDAIVAEYTEVESGKRADRPELLKAIEYAKANGAILLIAKLDRLTRNLHFLTGLMEKKVAFKAVDLPEADEFTIHIMAAMAQREAKLISSRTKAALTAKKARGEVLGCTDFEGRLQTGRAVWSAQADDRKAKVRAEIEAIKKRYGVTSLTDIAYELNRSKIKTTRGGEWSATQVSRVLN
jgi:DNA invertase Pin-like site-specific DNA recombinase